LRHQKIIKEKKMTDEERTEKRFFVKLENEEDFFKAGVLMGFDEGEDFRDGARIFTDRSESLVAIARSKYGYLHDVYFELGDDESWDDVSKIVELDELKDDDEFLYYIGGGWCGEEAYPPPEIHILKKQAYIEECGA